VIAALGDQPSDAYWITADVTWVRSDTTFVLIRSAGPGDDEAVGDMVSNAMTAVVVPINQHIALVEISSL
jgi:hypothetical protein